MNIANVKGVGEKRQKALEEMGIYTYADLFSRFPYRYIDLRFPDRVEDFRSHDMVFFAGEVLDAPARMVAKSRRRYVRTRVQAGGKKALRAVVCRLCAARRQGGRKLLVLWPRQAG